jgi:hypothetical protein
MNTAEMSLSMLFDNERFVVVWVGGACTGAEIVDKVAEASLFLHGDLCTAFEAQLEAWKQEAPSEEEVESYLNAYTALAMCPLVLH